MSEGYDREASRAADQMLVRVSDLVILRAAGLLVDRGAVGEDFLSRVSDSEEGSSRYLQVILPGVSCGLVRSVPGLHSLQLMSCTRPRRFIQWVRNQIRRGEIRRRAWSVLRPSSFASVACCNFNAGRSIISL